MIRLRTYWWIIQKVKFFIIIFFSIILIYSYLFILLLILDSMEILPITIQIIFIILLKIIRFKIFCVRYIYTWFLEFSNLKVFIYMSLTVIILVLFNVLRNVIFIFPLSWLFKIIIIQKLLFGLTLDFIFVFLIIIIIKKLLD